jgi:acetate kinase
MVRILTINTGSSSLKAALYELEGTERRILSAKAERIGLSGGRMRISDAQGVVLHEPHEDLPNHSAALTALCTWLGGQGAEYGPRAVGHRIVHGGAAYCEPLLIDDTVTAALRDLVPLDPDHLPQAIEAIESVERTFPAIPQAACFDTAFHRHMPRVARLYALPDELRAGGVRRYGFHGLSYEFIMRELGRLDPNAVSGKVVIAHLGNGASMAAVRDGVGIETTMGFTPLGGLVMGTRPGDLDPGVLLYLLQGRGMSPSELSTLVNKQAGLLGVSGISADMRDLLGKEADDGRAREAVELFCYQAKKSLGALIAVLGGLDTLIFTGGIGEHAAPVRERICAGLAFLGLQIDPVRNADHAPIISSDRAAVTVRVLATDEDVMIAEHTHDLLSHGGATAVAV